MPTPWCVSLISSPITQLPEHICYHDSNTNRAFPDTTLHNPPSSSTNRRPCTYHESQSASAMPDTSEPRPPAANAHIPSSSHVEDTSGHELPFVQPKTYLRPDPRAMESKPLTPLDKEQMHGLVSRPPLHRTAAICSHTRKRPVENLRDGVQG
jgi:hypothetical protein